MITLIWAFEIQYRDRCLTVGQSVVTGGSLVLWMTSHLSGSAG